MSNPEIVEEIAWTETVEISLDHFRLDVVNEWFITHFQKLTDQELDSPLFKIVDEFARNKNPLVLDANLLGSSSKPLNLGFIYKLFYRLGNSLLAVAQVYA